MIRLLLARALARRYNPGDDCHFHDIAPNAEAIQVQMLRQVPVWRNPEQKDFMIATEDIILATREWLRLSNSTFDLHSRDLSDGLKLPSGRQDLSYSRQRALEERR
jgi:hypothetical protein